MTGWLEKNVGLPLLKVHDTIYQRSGGRIGHRIPIPGAPPSLLLHTVGAKTGRQRTNTLSYFQDGGSYYVVASNGGQPKAPGWYHNVKAHPEVEINVGPQRLAVTAVPVPAGDPDYPRMWSIVDSKNGGRYGAYQRRTSRRIPLVKLTPTA